MGSPRSAPREPECPCAEPNVVFTLDFQRARAWYIHMSLEATETKRPKLCCTGILGRLLFVLGGYVLVLVY